MLYLTILIKGHVRGPYILNFFKFEFGHCLVNNFDQFGQHLIDLVDILVTLVDNLVNTWSIWSTFGQFGRQLGQQCKNLFKVH